MASRDIKFEQVRREKHDLMFCAASTTNAQDICPSSTWCLIDFCAVLAISTANLVPYLTKWSILLIKYLSICLTGMELNSSVCVIMYFYFLLTPWVYVGISTKFLVLVQKKTLIFCMSEALTKYQTRRLGFQPRTCGNQNRSIVAGIPLR